MTATLLKARNPRAGSADYTFRLHDAANVQRAAHRAREKFNLRGRHSDLTEDEQC